MRPASNVLGKHVSPTESSADLESVSCHLKATVLTYIFVSLWVCPLGRTLLRIRKICELRNGEARWRWLPWAAEDKSTNWSMTLCPEHIMQTFLGRLVWNARRLLWNNRELEVLRSTAFFGRLSNIPRCLNVTCSVWFAPTHFLCFPKILLGLFGLAVTTDLAFHRKTRSSKIGIGRELGSSPFSMNAIFHQQCNLCFWNIFPIALTSISCSAYQEIKLFHGKTEIMA